MSVDEVSKDSGMNNHHNNIQNNIDNFIKSEEDWNKYKLKKKYQNDKLIFNYLKYGSIYGK